MPTRSRPERVTGPRELGMPADEAAAMRPDAVVAALGTDARCGLDDGTAARRRALAGPNAVRSHRADAVAVLFRQLRSPLLTLLVVTAAVSFVLGERTDAVIIAAILAASAGLGFTNEYRAERATEELHAGVQHTVIAVRDGAPRPLDVVDLVPGDLVRLRLGTVVPADLRLIGTGGLECDESVLTGESLPVVKGTEAVRAGTPPADQRCVAFMGTVVHAGTGSGVVIATGPHTEFGRIAAGLAARRPETGFQAGLRRFSLLLVRVAIVLTALILAVNLLLDRPLIDTLLFSLAITVGITPQLLPAVVATGLANGSRRLARHRVLVKRLAGIEDLGDMDVLVTDKTGTLTEGRIVFGRSVDPAGHEDDRPRRLGLLATDAEFTGGAAVAGDPLDLALWRDSGDAPAGYSRVAALPFDHDRRMATALVDTPGGARLLVTKGAPEAVLAAGRDVPAAAQATADALFAAGGRVVAVATRPAPGLTSVDAADERDLTLAGFLVFTDPPKKDVARSLHRLGGLGVQVKIATGDNPQVAKKLWHDLGLPATRTLTGPEVDRLADHDLSAVAAECGVFARVSPEQKARLVRALRGGGRAVGFLGDGVNDALALHEADVGISVDTAADVAEDAADIVLLEKSLGILAAGVVLPLSPLAGVLGFVAPPAPFYLALAGLLFTYLLLVEAGKKLFFARPGRGTDRRRGDVHRLQRRAARFSRAAPAGAGGGR